jgi:EmrB/QacA subfamily drug resistance transporter
MRPLHKNWALAVLAIGQFMVVLDVTIVNVALPAIASALGFSSASQLQWVITAYALAFGGFLLLGGRAADIFGRRRMFMIGVGVFAVASVIAGFTESAGVMIAVRALQGLGGAMLSPAALSSVLNIFKEGKERNRALGVWSGVSAGGGAVGLLLGGILTQYAGWRWIFFINLPVALVVMFLAPRFVPAGENEHPGENSADILGAVTITGGLMMLVYALVKANDYGWGSGKTFGLLAAAVGLLVAFVVNESLVKRPLIPLRIFRNRNVAAGNITQLFITASMFSVFFFLTLYMQQILHFSPVKTGLANLPFTFVIGITAAIISRRLVKIGSKRVLMVAPLVMAAGLYYFSRMPVNGNYLTDILPGIVLMAAGLGAAFVSLTAAATAGTARREAGLAAGLINTSQQIGGALGLAILTSISTARVKADMVAAHGNPAALPQAYVNGFHVGFLTAVGFAITAALIAAVGLATHVITPEEDQLDRELEAETIPVAPGI